MSDGHITCKCNFGVKWNATWTIKQFSTKSDILTSPTFLNQFRIPTSWYMDVHPKGDLEGSEDYLSIFFFINEQVDLEFSVTVAFVNTEMREVQTSSFKYKFKDGFKSGYGFQKFAKLSYVLDKNNKILNDDDDLIISCKISCNNFDITRSQYGDRLQEFDDFEKLLGNNDLFADVTFRIEDKELPAHKSILSSRSSVFSAMFKHDVEENHSNTVIIVDIKYTVMHELLRFVYTGKVHDIDKIAPELLAAANKYDLKGLKCICENSLYYTLNTKNAIEYLKVADLHEAATLKLQVINYILKNSKAIVKKIECKNILEANLDSSLLTELLYAALENM